MIEKVETIERVNESSILNDYLICPELKLECLLGMTDEYEYLSCACGKKYNKFEEMIALRHIDSQKEFYEKQVVERNKYSDETFVSAFLTRQYGTLVKFNDKMSSTNTDRMFSRLLEIKAGGEMFYQTLLGIAKPYLESDSVILDVGCGVGRLTGELGRAGVKLAIGLDYSPLMIMSATKVILSNQETWINVNLPYSKINLQNAFLFGWGLKNCAFLIADAQFLPIRTQCIDFVACINLLHRVREPRRVIHGIERVLKKGGILLTSNSYDWSEEYTPQELWFDDFGSQLDRTTWEMENEMDGIQYLTQIYNRKYTLAFNHIQIYRKIK